MRLYPLAGQPLGFSYLFASHPLFDAVFVALCILNSLGRREIPPHIAKHIVLRDSFAIVVLIAEVELGIRTPLLCY